MKGDKQIMNRKMKIATAISLVAVIALFGTVFALFSDSAEKLTDGTAGTVKMILNELSTGEGEATLHTVADKVRGDFDWGICGHPYPIGTSPSNPMTTDMDPAGAAKPVTGDYKTSPWITVVNLELYQQYFEQPFLTALID